MKKEILRKFLLVPLAILAAIALSIIFQNSRPTTVRAIGDLSVDWGVPSGQPIFVVNNIAPGENQVRTVSVTNGGGVVRAVGVRGVKGSETGSLSTILDFVISQNGTDLYGGGSPTGPKTLEQFFTESAGPVGIFLSNLDPSASTNYTFKVIFNSGAGNPYQGKQVVFDLSIGITIEVPAECSGIAFSGPPIYGTSGGDNLTGTAGNDLIFGLEGGDSIKGNGGDDCLVGGAGSDSLKGGDGNDVILGQGDSDALKGENGNDKLYGGEGSDGLDGGAGNDYLDGGGGSDSLKGGNGNDILFGREGSDGLKGGAGDDYLDGGPGSDSLKGEDGIDTCLNGESTKTCEL